MNAAIPLPADAPPVPRLFGLRILLGVAALIEVGQGLWFVSDLLIPGYKASGLDGAIARAHLAVHPVLALAALLFVVIGRLREATILLGALVLLTWVNEMPSVLQHGLDLRNSYTALQTVPQIIAFPLMAACGIASAARHQRPGMAAALVSIPTLFMVLFHAVSMVVFAIGVTMYGF